MMRGSGSISFCVVRVLLVPHSSAIPLQMKSSMSVIRSIRRIDVDMIFKRFMLKTTTVH